MGVSNKGLEEFIRFLRKIGFKEENPDIITLLLFMPFFVSMFGWYIIVRGSKNEM